MLRRQTLLAALTLASLTLPAQAAFSAAPTAISDSPSTTSILGDIRPGARTITVPDIAFSTDDEGVAVATASPPQPPSRSQVRPDPRVEEPDEAEAAPPPADPQASTGQQIVDYARSQIGVPYVYGGSTPYEGFDCSGLVMWAYAQAGIQLPRIAADQGHAGVETSEPAPGDIVFWPDYHVGIYVGDGLMVDASVPGAPVAEHAIWGTPEIVHIPAAG
jgi:cell wall-associated NlpC family hydrolase